MLLAEGGRLDVYYSHWGAQSLLGDALRGPDRFIGMVQECTKDDNLIQDAVWANRLLLIGPRVADRCADREPGRPPLEDSLGGGILIDVARRTMAWWYCAEDPPEAELADVWSGWQVSRLEGGLPEQMDRSGRDGREFALSQQRIEECLGHDLSRSADFDPIAAIRKLAGEGGTINPEALKWPRAKDL